MIEVTHFYDLFKPAHYTIELDINREKKLIKGCTTIVGMATQNTIDIHQKKLTIETVKVNNEKVPFTVDNTNDTIRITNILAGKITLVIVYSSSLTDSMMGIYSSYYTIYGQKKQLVGTQFETDFARQAFPCIDEPEAKATFDLAIMFDEHPGETIISNMPEVVFANGYHYFATTVRMSTYLVAFAFGELQSKHTTTKSGVKVGIFSTKAHKINDLDFALDIAKRSIEFYEYFYQTPYPLPHSWQLALPDFSAGAMENWGLITYRESYLLLDLDNTSLANKQLVATVIAHELAHQWFGDLVTMKWWDDLWLNESFANMMEYVAIDTIEPDWHIWELFQKSDVPVALSRDATDGVQAIHINVEKHAEINAMFDAAIVYAKGARMLVMVRSIIGDDALRNGLKAYFKKHQYSNTIGADLWEALSDAAKIDVGAIMQSWLEQPGYPMVVANIIDGQLILEQTQFFIGDGQKTGRLWQIPLNSNYSAVPTIMNTKTVIVGNYHDLRNMSGKPFQLNVGNNSHFIVKYQQQLLDDIINNAGEELDAISKSQLLQNLWLLSEGHQISYADVIPVLIKFANDLENVVNASIYRMLDKLKLFITPNSVDETELKKLYDKLSYSQMIRLGWSPKKNEDINDKLTRSYVLSASLYAGNLVSITIAHQLFTDNWNRLALLPADTRVFILTNEILHYSSQHLFDQLFEEYRKTNDPSYKIDIRDALTCTTDPELIHKIIKQFKYEDSIKPQDLLGWFRGVMINNKGQIPAWKWIRDEWDWLENKVGGDMEFISYVTVIADVFKTNNSLDEFKLFFEPKINFLGITREILMDIKIMETRIALIETEKLAVNNAVKQEVNS